VVLASDVFPVFSAVLCVMEFPYGKAPLVILLFAIASGLAIVSARSGSAERRPDLVMAIFAKEHAPAYRPIIEAFERDNNVRISLQVVDQRALDSRLQAALQVGAEVPDLVELLDGTMGTFTAGRLEDVGLVDLTDRVAREHLQEKLVASRFAKWSSRGRVFALPHDVHPVMLAYRRDIVESLGIDVTKLTTWEEFCRVGRDVVTKDSNGDGVVDRYMLDLDTNGGDTLRFLLLQAGERLLTDSGDVGFDTDGAAQIVEWYVRQNFGPNRIAFSAGWGQTLAQAMNDGLVLFYMCPDWRSRSLEVDVPKVAGKMALMPLPAWKEGGIRTSTWGGTGLAITKQCRSPDLAWKLAMRLYYEPSELGKRFAATNILPPLRDAWRQPEFDAASPYYSGQRIGRAYADLAAAVPAEPSSAFRTLVNGRFLEAYTNASLYYQQHGEVGLHDYITAELKRQAKVARQQMARNVFLVETGGAQ
jgi:arabinosaccharide transport system substrate-binding protein